MKTGRELTIDLISNAITEKFGKNTIAKLRKQLAQPLMLEEEWQLSLTSISFQSKVNNVISKLIVVYINSVAKFDASHQRSGHLKKFRKCIYNSLDQLMKKNVQIAHLKQHDFSFDKIIQKLLLSLGRRKVYHLNTKKFLVFSASRV